MRQGARWPTLLGSLAFVAALALPTMAAATPTATVTATASSHNRAVTSQVWVTFGRLGFNTATIAGTASGVATGSIATLEATTFPFKAPMAPVQTTALSVAGSSAPFTFSVAPDLETRYQVAIFATPTSPAPEAATAVLPVYVTSWSSASNSETCAVQTCTVRINMVTVLPRSTIPVEKAKHQFLYLDIVHWNGGHQPAPTTFHLVPASVSAPSVSGAHVRYRIAITYQRPSSRLWWWFWESCARDTVARDGLGLAGPHGCGNPTVSPHATYLG